jgi:hypothetical protein
MLFLFLGSPNGCTRTLVSVKLGSALHSFYIVVFVISGVAAAQMYSHSEGKHLSGTPITSCFINGAQVRERAKVCTELNTSLLIRSMSVLSPV